MVDDHPNLALIERFNPADLSASAEVLADDVVFHFFNPRLPELEGDYTGLIGIESFFKKIGNLSRGTFRVEPISHLAVGDELVVVQTRNRLTLEENAIAIDVVVVFRIVENQITEIWDIPSAFSTNHS